MKLHNKILVGLVGGAAAGLAADAFAGDATWPEWISEHVARPVGQVFLRLLRMTVMPLVFASLVLGVAGLGDVRRLGRIGGMTIGYFLLSTALATLLGLLLVGLVRPGEGLPPELTGELLERFRGEAASKAGTAPPLGLNLLWEIVPTNPVAAAADDTKMLQVVFFSLVFGLALALVPRERAKPLFDAIAALGDVVVKIIDFAMALAPYGVFCLVFAVTAEFSWGLLQKLGVYAAVVLAGLLLHGAVTVSLLVRVLGGRSPRAFWSAARASIVTAFSTSSSNATLPTNIKVATENLSVSPRVAGFVLPLGATLNMNGTAIYEGITVLFLAQVMGVELSVVQQGLVMLLAVITAIGAAGVPGGSLPLMMVVLAQVGVPPESIAIILGIDRILDMSRTVLNVTGDLSAAVFIDRFFGRDVDAGAVGLAPVGGGGLHEPGAASGEPRTGEALTPSRR